MTASLFLRRTHMYLALFLTPWMTMYALSTVVFNHGELLQGTPNFIRERQLTYTHPFPAKATPRRMAEQIFADLHLPGAFQVESGDELPLRAVRQDPVTPRRITYSPEDHSLLVEREAFRTSNFLTRLHSSLGYGGKHAARQVWAAGVDLSILATFLWIFSGFWMWWELKITRVWGAVATVIGLALFALFLVLA